MSKNKRFILNTVIVALVILLLGGGIYLLTRPQEGDSLGEMVTDDDKYKIFSYSVAELQGASVTNQYGSYRLYRRGSSWEIEGFEGVGLNASMLDNLVYGFQDVKSSNCIEKNAKELSIYGLATPSASLKLELSEGGKTFFIGDKTPDGTGYYFYTDTSLDVYVMDSYMVDVINLTARDYADIGSSFAAEDITAVRICAADGAALNVVRRPEGQRDQYGLLSYWDITEPTKHSASNTEVAEKLTGPVADMENNVSGIFVSTDENLAQMGLAAPQFSVRVETQYETVSYKISAPRGEYRYILRDGSGYILRVDSEECDFAALRAYDLAEKYLALVEIGLVKTVTIEEGGRRTELAVVDGNSKEAAFYANGMEVDPATFRTFYSHIVALNVSGEAQDPKKESVVGSIEYSLISGESIRLEFAPYDDRNYAVFVNGSGLYTAAKKEIDKVFKQTRETFE